MNRCIKPLLLLFLICSFFSKLEAQSIELKIELNDTLALPLLHAIQFQKTHKIKQFALDEFARVSTVFEKMGFINHKSTFLENDSIIIGEIRLEHKIDFIRIYYDLNLFDNLFLKKITTNITSNYIEIPFSKIEETLNSITSYFETKGDSFVEVSLTHIRTANNIIEGNLSIKNSNKRSINKIIVKGYPEFPIKLFKNHFQINKNTVFNSDLLKTINDKIATLPYINQLKPSEVLFSKDSTILYLYLSKKSKNSANGLIGLSNEQQNNKLALNGNATIKLINSFNKGESLELIWDNLKDNHNSLSLSFSTPYIYNTIISPKLSFQLYKQDSTYVSTITNLGATINLSSDLLLHAQYKTEYSKITSISQNKDIQDYKKFLAGFTLDYNSPIKNFPNVSFGYLIGKKTETEQTLPQQQYLLNLSYIIPINYRNHIYLKQTGELIQSKSIAYNELFRIGGASSIRGFDELSILANLYSVTNLEYHYKLDNRSSIYSITDYAYTENRISNIKSNFYGIGIGYMILSEKYLLNLSYVIGKFNDSSLNFNNSKLHINVIYYF